MLKAGQIAFSLHRSLPLYKYVEASNLSTMTTDQDILDLFSKYGPCVYREMTDPFTGHALTTQYIEYKGDDEAVRAIRDLNGSMFMGRKITVKEAEIFTAKNPAPKVEYDRKISRRVN
jgi:RNA recognition motif-containing protein